MTDNQLRMMWTLAYQDAENQLGADASESALRMLQHRNCSDREWLDANREHWTTLC